MIEKVLRNKYLVLIVIIMLAFVLRFWQLNNYPAFNADEASIGYDAYSLIQTGKDQHGNAWPVDFQSFNDYKPGLYVYIVMPFVKILGLNEWAVRTPNALIGVISVYVIYLLVKELLKEKERDFSTSIEMTQGVGLVAALFLAISPWHIQFSRGGWEVNTATFFIMAGVLFWIKYFNNSTRNIKYLMSSIFFFVLSIYCYQATRVVTPLIGIGLVIIYRKEILSAEASRMTHIVIASVFGVILVIPLLLDFTHGGVLNRAAGVGLFADPGPRSRVEEQRGNHDNPNSKFVVLLHNKIVNYAIAFSSNWMSHFHGEFLFLSGDAVTRNKVPETGQMYLIDIVFLGIGLISIFKMAKLSNGSKILLMWLIVGPVASALTFQAPSALRAENIVIPLIIISALGAVQTIKQFNNLTIKQLRLFAYLFIGLLVLWSFARYELMYWEHMSKEYPYSSQYGVKELVDYISKNDGKYSKVLVTDRYDQPYVLFLFYMKYSPAKFQSEHSLTQKDQFGLSTVNHFDKYYFTSIKFDEAKPENPNSLIIGTNEEIPKEANIVKDIYGTNGFKYFRIVAN